MTLAIALILRPLALLVLLGLVCLPARLACQRYLPAGRLRNVLLWRLPDHRKRA